MMVMPISMAKTSSVSTRRRIMKDARPDSSAALKLVTGSFDGALLVELVRISSLQRTLALFPAVFALATPRKGQRIEKQRCQDRARRDQQRERKIDAEEEEGGAQATDKSGDRGGEADHDQGAAPASRGEASKPVVDKERARERHAGIGKAQGEQGSCSRLRA